MSASERPVREDMLWLLAADYSAPREYDAIVRRLGRLSRLSGKGWPMGLERSLHNRAPFGPIQTRGSEELAKEYGRLYRHRSSYMSIDDRPFSELAAWRLWKNTGTIEISTLSDLNRILGGDGAVRGFEHFTTRFASGHRVRFVEPERVGPCLGTLMGHLRSGRTDLHPITFATAVMVHIFQIHPFKDGNGRLGRLLFQAAIRQRTGLAAPLLPLFPYFEHRKAQMLHALHRLDIDLDPNPFFEGLMIPALQSTIDAVERIVLESQTGASTQ